MGAHQRNGFQVTPMYSYDRTAATSAHLTTKLRQEVNYALDRRGFGGRERWRKPGEALAEAFNVLARFGIEMDEVVNSHILDRPKGSYQVNIAFTNQEDSFSPTSISNSMLALSWEDLGNHRFEVIAYLS